MEKHVVKLADYYDECESQYLVIEGDLDNFLTVYNKASEEWDAGLHDASKIEYIYEELEKHNIKYGTWDFDAVVEF